MFISTSVFQALRWYSFVNLDVPYVTVTLINACMVTTTNESLPILAELPVAQFFAVPFKKGERGLQVPTL